MIENLPSRYTLLERLGAGAMGEVVKAYDQRARREVAIKMLPAALAQDPERRQRLRREASLLARLDHPNIASVYDLEDADGAMLLVLEYVAGRTLSEIIAAEPIPLDRALAIAGQITEALEAAHAQGVIHRDLKPANILITESGAVKVLDFGLAKALPSGGLSGDPWEPSSLSHDRTLGGTVLGTIGYMSPEQARGLPVDRRTDIWAFGCVLFEMLSGQRAFRGDTTTDTLVRIVEGAPDWSALPAETPAGIVALLRRCLTRDVRLRLRDIGEAWVAIERVLRGDHDPAPAPAAAALRLRFRWAWLAGLGLIGVAVLAGGSRIGRRATSEALPLSYELALPPGSSLGGRVGSSVAISPDGRLLACIDQRGIWLHPMDSLGFRDRALGPAGTDPEFSPDGRAMVVRGDGATLTRLTLSDGSLDPIAPAAALRGVCWGADDSLTYAPGFNTGLLRVSVRGGTPRVLTRLDTARGEVTHRWPEVLPDGRSVLFTVRNRFQPSFDRADIAWLNLRTGERRTLIRGGTCGRYARSGHIVFARGDRLLAAPFDLRAGQLTGSPVEVVTQLDVNPATGAAQFCVSSDGTLAYRPLPPGGWTDSLVWYDHVGHPQQALRLPGLCENADLSPDGRRVAVTLVGAQDDIGVYDLESHTLRRITFDPAEDSTPLWSPDGHRILFCSSRSGAMNLYLVDVDSAGAEQRLTSSPADQAPCGWAPDGRHVVFTQEDPVTGTDLWMLDVRHPGQPIPYLRSRGHERGARVSPDGRWVAYESTESGTNQIYVSPMGDAAHRIQVSEGDCTDPQWAPDGRALYFAHGDQMLSAPVRIGARFTSGPPRLLFRFQAPAVPAMTPDGRHFLGNTPPAGSDRVIVHTAWFSDLRRLAPAAR